MNAVDTRDITTGSDNTSFTATDDHGLALEGRVIAFLDGSIKRITINMSDGERI